MKRFLMMMFLTMPAMGGEVLCGDLPGDCLYYEDGAITRQDQSLYRDKGDLLGHAMSNYQYAKIQWHDSANEDYTWRFDMFYWEVRLRATRAWYLEHAGLPPIYFFVPKAKDVIDDWKADTQENKLRAFALEREGFPLNGDKIF